MKPKDVTIRIKYNEKYLYVFLFAFQYFGNGNLEFPFSVLSWKSLHTPYRMHRYNIGKRKHIDVAMRNSLEAVKRNC